MIRIHQIKLSLEEDIETLPIKIAKKLRIPTEKIIKYHIFKESIDARKQSVIFSYTVDVEVEDEQRFIHRKDISATPDMKYVMPNSGDVKMDGRVVVVGFGPAGMYAALLLAQKGYKPLVIERGGDIDTRVDKVQDFWENGILDETCNVQFGEGGAGTFSDGKLTTRSKDLRSRKVLEEFVRFGAPEEILYEAHPHIGTDKLRNVVKAMREEIIALGGEIHFYAKLQDVQIKNDKVSAVRFHDTWHPCGALLLAIGHSARDTFKLLQEKAFVLEAKAFAVGVRIEHPQKMIDEAQYKEFAHHPKLEAAQYRLTHTTAQKRGVYTFCMCPGGQVVASASSHGELVVNGMSEHARDKENANSALLVQVGPKDYGSDVMDGVNFQRMLEKRAYELGGGTYHAPAQCVGDYLKGVASTTHKSVQASYRPGVQMCDLHALFPDYINEALHEAILSFESKLHGFAHPHALMTGVETRSSSPIRIVRDKDTLTSSTISNVYPSGEGAGYAGGIVSAAIDGLRCAEKIIETYKK